MLYHLEEITDIFYSLLIQMNCNFKPKLQNKYFVLLEYILSLKSIENSYEIIKRFSYKYKNQSVLKTFDYTS